jgi:hypothetical protein
MTENKDDVKLTEPDPKTSFKNSKGDVTQYRSARQKRLRGRVALIAFCSMLLTFIYVFQGTKTTELVFLFSLVTLGCFAVDYFIPRTVNGEDKRNQWAVHKVVNLSIPIVCSAVAFLIAYFG